MVPDLPRGGQPMVNARNNFDSVRLLAAAMVLYSHQLALSGRAETTPLHFATWGYLGVMMFFVISGYLVCTSWERDPAPWRFLRRRALRIWPALAVVTVLSSFVLGPLLSHLPWPAYFASGETWAYLATAVFWIQQTLPGVFQDNPFARAVNGSLWTIPYEVGCYLGLLLCGRLGLLKRIGPSLLVWLLAWLTLGWIFSGPGPYPRIWSLELGCCFVSGVLLQQLRPLWQKRIGPVLISAALLAAGLHVLGWTLPAVLLLMPVVTLAFGTCHWPVLSQAGRWGDFSYGLYIYAFPVQQCVVMFWGPKHPLLAQLLLSLLLSLGCAAMSWHLIEKPALRYKPRAGARALERKKLKQGDAATE